jgi:SAM-dependent methyltransferase
VSVIWHDLECGSYVEDLPLWRGLAAQCGGEVLDIGAGTGRVALDLARAGHVVTALDSDPELLAELERRALGLEVTTVRADARQFEIGRRFSLCIVPMQTIQLLGGMAGRAAFLACVASHLRPGGLAAIALADTLELFDTRDGAPGPLPDITERDGVVYASHPTAVRVDPDGFVLERRRETVMTDGTRLVEDDAVRLDRLSPDQLEAEALGARLRPVTRRTVRQTADYSGSVVVMLSA